MSSSKDCKATSNVDQTIPASNVNSGDFISSNTSSSNSENSNIQGKHYTQVGEDADNSFISENTPKNTFESTQTYENLESISKNEPTSEASKPLLNELVPEEPLPREPPLPDEPVPEEPLPGEPPLPNEPVPETNCHKESPLSDETVSETSKNDTSNSPTNENQAQPSIAWSEGHRIAAIWDPSQQAYYFWDTLTNTTSWNNPLEDEEQTSPLDYTAKVQFNRLSGKFMPKWASPELRSEENKAHKHMEQYFDINSSLNSHNGQSLLAERRNKRYTRKEMEQMKRRTKEKKEMKRRALYDIASDEKDFRRRKIIRY
ncbi:WW domain-containing protein C2F3.14c [Schizosaccharomyces pombe]